MYTNTLGPTTSEAHLDAIEFQDGTRITYDSNRHALSVTCVGAINLKATTIKLTADAVQITRPVSQSDGDIESEGISVQNHVHPDRAL